MAGEPDGLRLTIQAVGVKHSGGASVLADLLRPGGWILWETFTVEQRRFGPPHRAAWLLDAGELPQLCEAAGLEVVEARESVAEPAGPAVASVRARRRIPA